MNAIVAPTGQCKRETRRTAQNEGRTAEEVASSQNKLAPAASGYFFLSAGQYSAPLPSTNRSQKSGVRMRSTGYFFLVHRQTNRRTLDRPRGRRGDNRDGPRPFLATRLRDEPHRTAPRHRIRDRRRSEDRSHASRQSRHRQ